MRYSFKKFAPVIAKTAIIMALLYSKKADALNVNNNDTSILQSSKKLPPNKYLLGKDTLAFYDKPRFFLDGFEMRDTKDLNTIPYHQISFITIIPNNDKDVVKIATNNDSVFNTNINPPIGRQNWDNLPAVRVVSYHPGPGSIITADAVPVTNLPSYPGGVESWIEYLQKHLRGNTPTDNNAPVGEYAVTVSFLVNTDGKISDPKIINAPNPDYGTSAEAIRVVMHSGEWIPGVEEKRKVAERIQQKIVFEVLYR